MNQAVRILNLEDSPDDSRLMRNALVREGLKCEVTRVDTKADFIDKLKDGGFDLIIADYSLPSFDGILALALAKENSPQTPFIFFTGAMREERAVKTLNRGATDYILKDNSAELAAAVQRAIETTERKSEIKSAAG